jgi:hypothetical protein
MERSFAFGSFDFFDTLRIYGYQAKSCMLIFSTSDFRSAGQTYTYMDSRDVQCTYIYTGIDTNSFTAFTFASHVKLTLTVTRLTL